MPTTVSRGITVAKPFAQSTPVLRGFAAATSGIIPGSILIDNGSGLLTLAADGQTSLIVGVSLVTAGTAASSVVEYVPAFTSVVFEITLEDDAAGTSHTLVAADMYRDYALERDSGTAGRFFIDENDANGANDAMTVIGFKESLAENATQQPPRVYARFLNTVTIYDA